MKPTESRGKPPPDEYVFTRAPAAARGGDVSSPNPLASQGQRPVSYQPRVESAKPWDQSPKKKIHRAEGAAHLTT